MIDELITSTLKALGVPTQRTVFTGKPKPETYTISQMITSLPNDYANDDNETIKHTLRVHIYSKRDYTQLLDVAISALKAAGFVISSIDNEIYEEETGYYHRPITIKFLEEINNAIRA